MPVIARMLTSEQTGKNNGRLNANTMRVDREVIMNGAGKKRMLSIDGGGLAGLIPQNA